MRCNAPAFTGYSLDNTPLPTDGSSIPNRVREPMSSGTYQHFSDRLHSTFQRFDQINLCPVVSEVYPNDCGFFVPTPPESKIRKINNFHIAYFVLSAKADLRKLYKIRNIKNLKIPNQNTQKKPFTRINRKTMGILAYRRILHIFES